MVTTGGSSYRPSESLRPLYFAHVSSFFSKLLVRLLSIDTPETFPHDVIFVRATLCRDFLKELLK